jgi:MFS family permease
LSRWALDSPRPCHYRKLPAVPQWFAEFCLYLAIYALVISIAMGAYGGVVATTGQLAGMLKDARRGRRPTGVAATASAVIGLVLIAIAMTMSDSHARLATSALASVLLIFAITAACLYPIARFWTNEYWGLPPSTSITPDQLRAFGKVYVVFGIAFTAACVGLLIGLVPKLTYVGDRPVQAAFLGADLLLLAVAVVVAVRAWNLYKATRGPVPPLPSTSHG